MPRTVCSFGVELTGQQLWCWGQDIEYPDGNLLMQFGFNQHRDQAKLKRSTYYQFDDEELHICMWGFGMFFWRRDLGGLFLGRLDFFPKWAPLESLPLGIHKFADLPSFGRPSGREQWLCARKLWQSLLQWIARYERWLLTTVGIQYRRECVESWLRPIVRADQMARAWQFLSRRQWERSKQPVSQALSRYTFPAEAK